MWLCFVEDALLSQCPLFYWEFKLTFELAPVGQQRLFVRWCKGLTADLKGAVHTSVPRFVPLTPPPLSSFHVRAPPPSLGLPPCLGSRASESRMTPVPGTDGTSH
jgi:hypothetical protein